MKSHSFAQCLLAICMSTYTFSAGDLVDHESHITKKPYIQAIANNAPLNVITTDRENINKKDLDIIDTLKKHMPFQNKKVSKTVIKLIQDSHINPVEVGRIIELILMNDKFANCHGLVALLGIKYLDKLKLHPEISAGILINILNHQRLANFHTIAGKFVVELLENECLSSDLKAKMFLSFLYCQSLVLDYDKVYPFVGELLVDKKASSDLKTRITMLTLSHNYFFFDPDTTLSFAVELFASHDLEIELKARLVAELLSRYNFSIIDMYQILPFAIELMSSSSVYPSTKAGICTNILMNPALTFYHQSIAWSVFELLDNQNINLYIREGLAQNALFVMHYPYYIKERAIHVLQNQYINPEILEDIARRNGLSVEYFCALYCF